jgi:hypothetical protein
MDASDDDDDDIAVGERRKTKPFNDNDDTACYYQIMPRDYYYWKANMFWIPHQ